MGKIKRGVLNGYFSEPASVEYCVRRHICCRFPNNRTLARGEAMLKRAETVGCRVVSFLDKMRERGRAARRERTATRDPGADAAAADAGAV